MTNFLYYNMSSYTITHFIIYGDIACVSLPKTEITGSGAGVEKVKMSANTDNFITKIFLAIQLRK